MMRYPYWVSLFPLGADKNHASVSGRRAVGVARNHTEIFTILSGKES
jgi:hypothetical protein